MFLLGNALVSDLLAAGRWLAGGTTPPGTGATLLVFAILLAGIPTYGIWERLHSRSS